MNSSESNRCQNCLTVSNHGIGAVFTDIRGKSAHKVMSSLLSNEDHLSIVEVDILLYFTKVIRRKIKILTAVKDARLEPYSLFKIKLIFSHKKELANYIKTCISELLLHSSVYFD